MRVLVDTGILLRAFDRSDVERHRRIVRALRKLWSDNDELVTTAQNIAEFWNVSTRPVQARGGYGLPVAIVEQRVRVIERMGAILPFSRTAYLEWRRLLTLLQITGVAVHDARIVATMQESRITHIITLNDADFHRYPGITVLTPETVLQQ